MLGIFQQRLQQNHMILIRKTMEMLSELYMSCDSDEKEIFKRHIETLQNIAQQNII